MFKPVFFLQQFAANRAARLDEFLEAQTFLLQDLSDFIEGFGGDHFLRADEHPPLSLDKGHVVTFFQTQLFTKLGRDGNLAFFLNFG
jgi:hypothetical protein